jgi:undecaprenyl phosphate-alpha-L-ara4FN deformylase
MGSVALKIDVDTFRGTREGVPALAQALTARGIAASFYFSLGPDHTGWALKRVFRPGFLAKVSRTSVVSHYGFPTLVYGVLWPGPQIGQRLSRVIHAVGAHHETGVHCYDHVYWQDNVQQRDAAWTCQQFAAAFRVYEQIFGQPARAHCAAGWQFNQHLLALEDEYELQYASDSRGTQPFLPRMEGQTYRCPQLPTTLATLDELIGVDGKDADGAIDYLLDTTANPFDLHVFTLHAELEGQQLLPQFLRLIDTWQARGIKFMTLQQAAQNLRYSALPIHELIWGSVPNRSGQLALQG